MTPEWWLAKLEAELATRQANMALMDRYYRGDHPLPFLTKAHNSKMSSEFRTLLDDSRSNFMRLVVDVVEERLRVDGFRLSASQDESADQGSWDIWQANGLDSDSQTAFIESLVKGVSYLSVWAGEKGKLPSIAVEDPYQTIVGYEPGSNFRRRAAALKMWRDDWTGMDRANVYLPDGIHKFEAKGDGETPTQITATGEEGTFGRVTPDGSRSVDKAARGKSRWVRIENSFLHNPFGIVPIIPLRNRPRLLAEGESELADVYRIQNQINGFLFLLALAGYFGAHKQRWAVGLKLMEDDKGKPVEPYDVAIDRLLVAQDPEAKFGEFGQTDLGGYISAIEQKVQHIAVNTRTPRHYLLPEGQEPSGDSIKSAEAGLTKKVSRKQRPFGEGFEEAIRLARLFGGEKESPPDSEIVWADPEIRTEAEITDATIKKFQVGLIGRVTALTDLGYSQTAITRIMAEPIETLEAPAPPVAEAA